MHLGIVPCRFLELRKIFVTLPVLSHDTPGSVHGGINDEFESLKPVFCLFTAVSRFRRDEKSKVEIFDRPILKDPRGSQLLKDFYFIIICLI